MIITIDTTKDSKEDVRKAIEFLKQCIGDTNTPASPITPMTITPQTDSFIPMFGDDSAHMITPTPVTTPIHNPMMQTAAPAPAITVATQPVASSQSAAPKPSSTSLYDLFAAAKAKKAQVATDAQKKYSVRTY